MLELDDIGLFAELTPAGRERLTASAVARRLDTGEVLVRRGEAGRALFAVASGGVEVHLGSERVALGPGEVVGEMSLVSELPISATVVAATVTRVWEIDRETFDELLASEPGFQNALVAMLVGRMRARGARDRTGHASRAFVVLPAGGPSKLVAAVTRGVRHYAPGSQFVQLEADQLATVGAQLDAWRGKHDTLVVWVRAEHISLLETLVGPGDALLRTVDADSSIAEDSLDVGRFGVCDHDWLVIGGPVKTGGDEAWHPRVSADELSAAATSETWQPEHTPVLDRVVRWITRRLVGVALGAGAARGFAHLGVLAVLEEAGVPVDLVTGSSMGGIAGLIYGLADDVAGAVDSANWTLGKGGFGKVRWVPRSSLLSDRTLRRRAAELCAGRRFTDLRLPVQVVCTDLALGERVVLEQGSVEEAIFATSTIPGAFPPVVRGSRVLVDGALVSRIPVDLLDRGRCGLRLAVNVIPSPAERAADAQDATRLRDSFEGLLGFRHVLARSWELIGWRHGAADAAGADFLIEPWTSRYSGYDFTTIDEMVAAGRTSAAARIEEIRRAATALLRPCMG